MCVGEGEEGGRERGKDKGYEGVCVCVCVGGGGW